MIYPIYTQDIAKICPIIFQCLPKICPRYAQDIPKTCLRYAQDMPKICPSYPQDMAGIGKSGFSNMDLCVLLNLVQIRSQRLLIPVVRIVSTYEEPYMNFYEHFLTFSKENVKIWWFSSKNRRYAQNHGRNGKIWSLKYGLLRFVEPCSNKKPKASYTGCPNCLHFWRTLYELLWTFY